MSAVSIHTSNASRLHRTCSLGPPSPEASGQRLVYSSSGQQLVALEQGGAAALRCWALGPGTSELRLDLPAKGARDVVLTADGRCLATAGADGLQLLSMPSGELLREAQPAAALKSLCLSPDGTLLLAAGYKGKALLWDVAHWRLRCWLEGLDDTVHGCAFSPDGKQAFGVAENGHLQVWETRSGTRVASLALASSRLWTVAASPVGGLLAVGTARGSVSLIDTSAWRVVHQWLGPAPGVIALDFSLDGLLLAVAGDGCGFSVRTAHDGRCLFEYNDDADMQSSNATFSPDGTTIAWGQGDGTVGFWRVSA